MPETTTQQQANNEQDAQVATLDVLEYRPAMHLKHMLLEYAGLLQAAKIK